MKQDPVFFLRWKTKVKQLEEELATFKKSTMTTTSRADQLVKELEMSRAQTQQYQQQAEQLKRDFSHVLVGGRVNIYVVIRLV